jgi:hypothetical protein
MDDTLTEETAELGTIVFAIGNLCEELSIPSKQRHVLCALIRAIMHSALVCIQPTRRMSYLEQWKSFLCCLPDKLSAHTEDQRFQIAIDEISRFHLEDRRGKRKPATPAPDKANCLLDRDGEFWFAHVPKELRDNPQEQINLAQNPQTVFLRPFNQTRVFAAEYRQLHAKLKKCDDLKNEKVWESEFPDVPVAMVRRWFEGRKPTPSDLAMLIAAYRVGIAPSRNNLSTFREILATENLLEKTTNSATFGEK